MLYEVIRAVAVAVNGNRTQSAGSVVYLGCLRITVAVAVYPRKHRNAAFPGGPCVHASVEAHLGGNRRSLAVKDSLNSPRAKVGGFGTAICVRFQQAVGKNRLGTGGLYGIEGLRNESYNFV